MKKECLFIIVLISSLILGFSTFAQDADSELEKTKHKIHILNLLNGLELDKEQMQLVLDAAEQAEDIRAFAKEEIAQKEKEITYAYSEVLKVAQSGSLVIPDDVALRVHKVNRELDKLKQTAQERLTALAQKIKDNLQPHQLYVLDDYKPCIIPPAKQGCIGQADDPKGFTKVLEKVYKMPQEVYNLKKDKISRDAIDKLKAKVPPGFILDQERLKTQLLKAMDEARQMSDVDFTLKKDRIAQNIKSNLLPKKPPINI